MAAQDPKTMLTGMIQPWMEAAARPALAQEQVLARLLQIYSQTGYGRDHGAATVGGIADFRRCFPVMTYETYKPIIQRVMAGDVELLLNEDPIGWAITRGTTKGESKFIPMTPTDLKMRVSAGRAMMTYAVASGRFDLFQGVNLNLNWPSVVGTVRVGERDVQYGYSSGIYAKYVSAATPLRSLPTQDDIDALGGGKTDRDWEARFNLAYERCRDQKVTIVGGVAPMAVRFGRYMWRRFGKYPKDIWQPLLMTLGSVPGINTRLQPPLTAMYGPVTIREIYGTTEGIFGQQRDEKRAWVPNYDQFFFEVETRAGIKMLHEMTRGERGSLVVSTPILARYRIGDTHFGSGSPLFPLYRTRWGPDVWAIPLG